MHKLSIWSPGWEYITLRCCKRSRPLCAVLRRELSRSAVAAGEYSYFVFMIPSSHSNPEQIRNPRIWNLVVYYLIVVLLLIAGGWENLAEASTAPAVRKRRNHGTWASTYASSFLEIAGAVKIVSSVLFQESRVIPVWVLIILRLIPVLLLVLLLLHGTL